MSETSDTKKSIFEKTHIPRMLQEGRVSANVIFEPLMMKDSLDIVDEDRKIMLERCQAADEKHIVITHGTHTMADSAKYMGERVKDKTIVFVGAMVPFAWEHSDSMFNLGYAIAQAQQLPAGVYVAMNGRVFNNDDVRKNRDTGVFENLEKDVE